MSAATTLSLYRYSNAVGAPVITTIVSTPESVRVREALQEAVVSGAGDPAAVERVFAFAESNPGTGYGVTLSSVLNDGAPRFRISEIANVDTGVATDLYEAIDEISGMIDFGVSPDDITLFVTVE